MGANANKAPLVSVDRVLAALGAAACLVITLAVWWSVSQQQAMWPLPALYLIEVVALGGATAWGIWRGDTAGSLLAWAAIGALSGFSAMGTLSIGNFYLLVVALLGLAALWHDRHAWRRLPLHLGLALVAAVLQAALMLAIIQVINYP